MTMRFTQLVTHWNPDTALDVITFLDQLRAALWAVYGDAIVEQQREYSQLRDDDDETLELEFDDRIPF